MENPWDNERLDSVEIFSDKGCANHMLVCAFNRIVKSRHIIVKSCVSSHKLSHWSPIYHNLIRNKRQHLNLAFGVK